MIAPSPIRRRAAARSVAGRYLQCARRALAEEGRQAKALAGFRRGAQAQADHQTAKANYKSLARELERLGAQMAVAGKPSFNCAARAAGGEGDLRQSGARRSRPRDLCGELRVVREAAQRRASAGRASQREQDDFIARRNAGFRPARLRPEEGHAGPSAAAAWGRTGISGEFAPGGLNRDPGGRDNGKIVAFGASGHVRQCPCPSASPADILCFACRSGLFRRSACC